MRPYLELIKSDLRLALRDRAVIFFNYLFPLLFFFAFSELLGGEQTGTINYVVSMVLLLGILGNGLFGAGMRTVQDRENNILRRYKVAPITPVPLLVASVIVGWILYVPAVVMVLGLAHYIYGMPFPAQPLSLFLIISLGIFSFRAIGLILASVANNMQEVNILVQLLYMPMLFLSGALFPLTLLPEWLQMVSQYLPTTYLMTAMQGIFLQQETFVQNLAAAIALLLTLILGIFISKQLFRWEKEEKVPLSSKLWVFAVLAPFLLLGTFQLYSQDQIRKSRILYRQQQRQETFAIRGARVFLGDGEVMEVGTVVVRNGKIERVVPGSADVASEVGEEIIEAAGKTLLPGLIDAHVHLSAPGGVANQQQFDFEKNMQRALASYLYAGITAVKGVGDPLSTSLEVRGDVASGEMLGAELFVSGPLFTAPGGYGTQYLSEIPERFKQFAFQEMLRLPENPDQARSMVRDLASQNVDALKASLDAGGDPKLFNRMDPAIIRVLAQEADQAGLPMVVHTGDNRDLAEVVEIPIKGVEHGSMREAISPDILKALAKNKIHYNPTLTAAEAVEMLSRRDTSRLGDTLVQQVGPEELLERTARAISGGKLDGVIDGLEGYQGILNQGQDNLRAAYQAGVTLSAGSGAGNMLVIHGPTIQRELALWVEADIPPQVALQAATWDNARLLQADDRLGLIKEGYEANLLLVDGNPLEEIQALERISVVIFKGERVSRSRLFNQE